MNDFITDIALDLNCKTPPCIIRAGQFDVGRKIKVAITANGEPFNISECTAVCKGRKNDSTHFADDCIIADNTVIVTLTEQMLASKGFLIAKIVLSDSVRVYSTGRFVIDADGALEGNITSSDEYSVLNNLLLLVQAFDDSGAVIVDDVLSDTSLRPVQNKIIKHAVENAEKLENKITSFDITFVDKNNEKYPTVRAIMEYLANYFYNADEMDANFLSTDAKIGTKNLENKSVTMEKLAQAVLDLIDGKISNNAGAIGTDNLASSSVTTDKLANNAVTNRKIADGAISLEKIIPAYVDNAPSISAPFYGECLVKSGGVYNALKTKYDSSNIETGTGNFGIYAGATPGKSGTFTYQKVGNVVTVSCNLVMSAGQGCHFTGLPFKTAAQSIVMTRTLSTNTRCSVNANGTWISVQTNGTTFTDDDNVQITLSYSI